MAVTENGRSRLYQMEELELACRMSRQSVILARMVVLGLFHLALLAGLTPSLAVWGTVGAARAGVYLLTPYLLTAALGMELSRRVRSRECLPVCGGADGASADLLSACYVPAREPAPVGGGAGRSGDGGSGGNQAGTDGNGGAAIALIVILFSGFWSSSFFHDASNARFVICDIKTSIALSIRHKFMNSYRLFPSIVPAVLPIVYLKNETISSILRKSSYSCFCPGEYPILLFLFHRRCAMANFTRRAIKKTFLKLLNQRPLNQITVKDIVEDCGINRNSFYYHFEDLPALVDEIVEEQVQALIQNHPTISSVEECFDTVVELVMENKRAIYHIYNSLSRDVFERYLMDACQYIVSTYLKTEFAEKSIDPQDLEALIRLHKCACFGSVIDWLNGGMKDDISAYFRRVCALQKGWVETLGR